MLIQVGTINIFVEVQIGTAIQVGTIINKYNLSLLLVLVLDIEKECISNSLHYFLGFVPIGHFWQVSPFSPKNFLGSQSTVREEMI